MVVRSSAVRPLPPWLIVAGSLVIAFHLFTLIILVLAAPSGPWPTEFGPSMALSPTFAQNISDSTTPGYLKPLKMTHNYHFESNRTEYPQVYFEVKLKDEKGKVIETQRIPDPQANWWVRHRQMLLCQWLGNDQQVPYPQGEAVPAPGEELPKKPIWEVIDDQRTLGIKQIDDLELRKVFQQRERGGPMADVRRPSELSLVLARAYVRHLCFTHGAASGELLRYSKNVIPPAILLLPENEVARFKNEGRYNKLVSNFGEFSR
jgi:hypothetical protein